MLDKNSQLVGDFSWKASQGTTDHDCEDKDCCGGMDQGIANETAVVVHKWPG